LCIHGEIFVLGSVTNSLRAQDHYSLLASQDGKSEVGDQEDRESYQQTGDLLQTTQWIDQEGVRAIGVV
jgi:hypothetical protein